MKNKRIYHYNVNGFDLQTMYDEASVSDILEPMMVSWKNLQRQENRKIIVFLSAPPGCGKSTVTQFLELRSEQEPDRFGKIQALGLDGFHYHQAYLESHMTVRDGQTICMKEVKGSPETYDFEKLVKKLDEISTMDQVNMSEKKKVFWPLYSRAIHDVIEDALEITGDILVIEGNWLLLDESPWTILSDRCDDSIFISAAENTLKEALIQRKMKGGTDREVAERFYQNSDRRNVRRLLEHHQTAKHNLFMPEYGVYEVDS